MMKKRRKRKRKAKQCVFVCFYVYIIPACESEAVEDLEDAQTIETT